MYDLLSPRLDHYTKFAQDNLNLLEATQYVKSADNTVSVHSFTDFKTNKTYTVFYEGNNANRCVVTNASHPVAGSCYTHVQSQVKNLVYLGHADLGGGILQYDSWDLYNINTIFLFNNVSTTLVEPKLLALPPECI